MSDLLLVDQPIEGVTRITLNRPKRLNALSYDLFLALESTLRDAADAADCRAVVVTGAGRGFCAGLDLEGGFAPPEVEAAGKVVGGMDAQRRVARVLTTPRRLRVPVIAALNGPAVGGGLALALASDVRIASESARCSAAFIRIGLSGCDCGVSWLLPRVVGASAAFEMMLTGRQLDADECLRIGLVSRVVSDDELPDAALEVAAAITANTPFGVEMTKDVMWASLEAASLEDAMRIEDRTQILATLSDDMAAALAAFSDRRPATFKRR